MTKSNDNDGATGITLSGTEKVLSTEDVQAMIAASNRDFESRLMESITRLLRQQACSPHPPVQNPIEDEDATKLVDNGNVAVFEHRGASAGAIRKTAII